MSSHPVGNYAKAWKQSALEDGPAEFAPYGDYAEYLLLAPVRQDELVALRRDARNIDRPGTMAR
jgi:hypothetical protein